jgi:hypothetical protein
MGTPRLRPPGRASLFWLNRQKRVIASLNGELPFSGLSHQKRAISPWPPEGCAHPWPLPPSNPDFIKRLRLAAIGLVPTHLRSIAGLR